MFILQSRTVIKTVRLDMVSEEKGTFAFKVDILQNPDGTFSAELYEKIYYRVKPSFDLPEPDWEADEEFWVCANYQIRDDSPSDTPEACLDKVLQSLDYAFGFWQNQANGFQAV